MRDRSRDIAVSGIGLTTSLGVGVDQVWERLARGDSGVRPIDAFNTDWLSTKFAAQIPPTVVPGANPHERTRFLARDVLRQAVGSAGLDRETMARTRSQLFVAMQHPDIYLSERIAYRRALMRNDAEEAALILARLQAAGESAPLCQALSDEFGINGIPVVVTTACASSSSTIQLAVQALRRGDIDRGIVVAADASVTPEVLVKFNLLSALSTRNDNPARASRPFSRDRDGFVMGEGAGALILERSGEAPARFGFIVGCGDATDNFHRTRSHPSGQSIVDCMNTAIADADLTTTQIDYINAHGTSTPENDKMEGIGISALFGDRAPVLPVSSTKSMIGHTLSAAGAIEAIVTLLSIQRGFITPTINHGELDPEMALDVVPNAGRAAEITYALSNSFGFGGQNASLVFAAENAP